MQQSYLRLQRLSLQLVVMTVASMITSCIYAQNPLHTFPREVADFIIIIIIISLDEAKHKCQGRRRLQASE